MVRAQVIAGTRMKAVIANMMKKAFPAGVIIKSYRRQMMAENLSLP